MKTTLLILIAGFSAWLTNAAVPESSPEIIIGLSPFQPAAESAKQQALLQRFIVADTPNGSRVVVWDGWALTVVCDVQLPRLAFDSPAARAPRVAPALAALKQWFAGVDGVKAQLGLKDTGAIRIPEWLYAATAQPATGRRTIVILGSPFCLVPNEPSFSMVETRYPSDGHLSGGEKSIYSTADKRGRLANTAVLWAYPGEYVWASQYHRERVARWWSLFIAGQGPNAMLAAFSADTRQVLVAATRTNQRAIGEYAVNVDDAALVMHVAQQREVPVKVQARSVPPPEPRPQPVAKPEPPPAPAAPVAVVAPPPPAPPRPAPPAPKPTAQRQVAKPPPVFLDVTVVDRANHPVVDLDTPDFSVIEDGVRQETAWFTRERMPISLVVLIDTSGSISAKLGRIKAAASSIVRQGHPQDEFCIARFTGDASVVQDFTTNVASLEQALSRLKAGGETALLDAVKFAVQYANERGKHDRKGVILVTDGGEANSRCSRDEVLAALRAANTRLYSVAFPDGLDQSQSPNARGFRGTQPREAESRARGLMDELARVTGGRAFYPRQTTELDGIAESIALELRTQYRIGYDPTRVDRDGRWREVRVEVIPNHGREGMIARTRTGYFAPKSP